MPLKQIDPVRIIRTGFLSEIMSGSAIAPQSLKDFHNLLNSHKTFRIIQTVILQDSLDFFQCLTAFSFQPSLCTV